MNTEVPGGRLPDPGTDDPLADGFVLRMLPGSQLRRLREEAGIAPDRAGYEIRASLRRSAGPAQRPGPDPRRHYPLHRAGR